MSIDGKQFLSNVKKPIFSVLNVPFRPKKPIYFKQELYNIGWYRESAKWYRVAAERGNSRAQFALGSMYYAGRGVPRDYKEAAKWVKKAAEQGQAEAQYNLGSLYYYGRCVPQDTGAAAQWLIRAAKQGSAPAQNALGLIYHSGRGGIENHIEADKWYVLAAMQGAEFAQFAQELREHLDRTMTLDQIEEGQRRAREFLAVVEKSPKEDRRIAETVTQ